MAPGNQLKLFQSVMPACRFDIPTCLFLMPYLLHNVAKGSPSRHAFVKRSGKMMVPYLVDPNTDTEMFESADIVAYLDRTYAVGQKA